MRHAFGALSRVMLIVAVFAFAVLAPLAAHAQDLGGAGTTISTGIPWLDTSLKVLALIGMVASIASHFIPPTSGFGKAVSWMAGNFGKALTTPKPGTVTELRPPNNGFARVSLLVVLALGSLLVATAAHAQESAPAPAPAPVAAPADPAPAPSAPPKIGGCFANRKVCVGPTVALTLTAVNLTSKHVEAGFAPGVGVGFTYLPGTWSSIGLGAYFSLVPGSQGIPDNASGALIASFLNGWGRVGVSKGFLGDTSTRLLIGTGLDL